MTRRTSRTLSTLALATVLVLAGCGQGSDATSDPAKSPSEASPSSAATSASGADTPAGQVAGKSGSYSVTAPDAWRDATDQASQNTEGLDLVLLSSKQVDRFSDNLVVVVADGDEAVMKAEIEKGRVTLTEAGRKVSDADDLSIAGTTASGLTSTLEQQGIAITARSYALTHEGKVYLLTLSSSTVNEKAAMAALQQISDSWTWA